MVIHDLICSKCNSITLDQHVDPSRFDDPMTAYKCTCKGRLEIYYGNLTPTTAPNTHPSERVILYKSDLEGGKIQYPGRGDVPVPERLRRRGYEKVELNVRDLAKFEREHNVANERRHFDRNGRGF